MRFKKPDLYDTMINGIYTLSHTQVILSHVALSEVDTLEQVWHSCLLFSLWITFAYQKPFNPLIYGDSSISGKEKILGMICLWCQIHFSLHLKGFFLLQECFIIPHCISLLDQTMSFPLPVNHCQIEGLFKVETTVFPHQQIQGTEMPGQVT